MTQDLTHKNGKNGAYMVWNESFKRVKNVVNIRDGVGTVLGSLNIKEVPYATAKTLMGHSSIKTTIDVYMHINKNYMKNVRADIEGVVKIF